MNYSTRTPFSFALILAFSLISSAQAWRVAHIENEMTTEISIELVLNNQSIFTQTIPAHLFLNKETFIADSSLPDTEPSSSTAPSTAPALPLSPFHGSSSSTESFEDYPETTFRWPFYFPSITNLRGELQQLSFPALPPSYLLITTPLGAIYCVEGLFSGMPGSWYHHTPSNPRKPASTKILYYSRGLSGTGGTPERPCIISIGKTGLLGIKSGD
ncbi:hypothetical protein K2X40_00785 [Candidatus Babeliales bacterium]|nr:hypothetical protein [Candidatus Babeliales bacterium]